MKLILKLCLISDRLNLHNFDSINFCIISELFFFQQMEHYIKQNNVFNIYEDYFTDAPDVYSHWTFMNM
jgi:hypothetical protein